MKDEVEVDEQAPVTRNETLSAISALRQAIEEHDNCETSLERLCETAGKVETTGKIWGGEEKGRNEETSRGILVYRPYCNVLIWECIFFL